LVIFGRAEDDLRCKTMNDKKENKLLPVKNRIEELGTIESFLEELGEEWDIIPSLVLSLNLVLEEAFTNIVKYGYDDDEIHVVEIVFSRGPDHLKIEITDDGHEWDPTLKSEPDITLSAEERPVGGLGIFLIRKIMDVVEYKRFDNKNHLLLTKKI
jgi:serine/threonine-protein kinase RsbW